MARSQELHREREFWERYIENMNHCYFGLLSHLMCAAARHKCDYDIEDALLLRDIGAFFRPQKLQEI
jgi:hypothetical protein